MVVHFNGYICHNFYKVEVMTNCSIMMHVETVKLTSETCNKSVVIMNGTKCTEVFGKFYKKPFCWKLNLSSVVLKAKVVDQG